MNLAATIELYSGGPGSGCNPEVGVCGRKPGVRAKTLESGALPSQEGYLYHATNEERLYDIAKGSLKTHKPWEHTDQSVWPDGSKEKRSYFSKSASGTWAFSPEEGRPVILRMKYDPVSQSRESTGDFYAKKPIQAKKLEFLGEDDQWHSLGELKE